VDNEEVAALLEEYATLRANAGDRAYRVTAYRRAATAIALYPKPVLEAMRKGWDPQAIPGVGPSIAGVLREIAERGTWASLEHARGHLTLDAGAAHVRPERLPKPLQARIKLRGDLHTHTDATDGRDSILAMATAAKAMGYEYLAITDHSKETRVAGGLDEDRMKRHLARIRRADGQVEGVRLLAGAEVDILKDGRLDYSDALLRDMDVTVCSVHFRHKLSGPEQTQRILRGMSNDHADVLGHASGRRAGIRPGMAIDLVEIVATASAQGWCIEMNGSPERLDVDDTGARLCQRARVPVACDSDAHSTRELAQVGNALRLADKAGLAAPDVINSWSLAQLEKRFA